MSIIFELQRDKSLRKRLIMACLSVALLVSTIYIIISYRLALDLGSQSELIAIHQQAQLLHAELVEADHPPKERIQELIELIYLRTPPFPIAENTPQGIAHTSDTRRKNKQSQQKNSQPKVYVQVSGPDIDHFFNYHIDNTTLKKSLALINQKRLDQQPSQNGFIKIHGQHYIWQKLSDNHYTLLLIVAARSFDQTLELVIKRLSITSIIVFWIAVWLALTLSSWMNKHVQKKNEILSKLATHDPLTGLPNRLYLMDIIENLPPPEDKDSLYYAPVKGCLFSINLDRFKEVNDTFGHSAGDQLLIEIAQRLQSALSKEQLLMRTGGDEFLVWAPGISADEAELTATAMVQICNTPVMINKLAINTGASIGIALYPDHGSNAETLTISADIAMREAKRQRSGWRIFDSQSHQGQSDSIHRLTLRSALGDALSQRQIVLYYQPKIDLQTGQISGVEGLARWNHPDEGTLTPDYFIDLMEQSGHVQAFGRYIVREAISQLSNWQNMGKVVPIAINFSPYNLLDPGLLTYVKNLLQHYNVPPDRLEIELTESATSMNVQNISERLTAFKQLGIKLAIDDFGTGMSSLSYISHLNVDTIKIDRSFITDIDSNSAHKTIVESALRLSNAFHCKTVAEGVENIKQVEILQEMGCDHAQGYYYARPMTTDEITHLLKHNHSLPLAT